MGGPPPGPVEVRPGTRHSGWPFDRAHLDPSCAQAQRVCQLGPFDDDPGRWADQTRTPPLPLPPEAVETTLFQHGTAGFEGSYQELAGAPNVTLVLHPRLSTWRPGRATAGWTGWRSGATTAPRCFVRARLVVLAAGGIENPRLLQLSRRVHRRG